MEQQTAARLIEENLHTLFAWSMARLYDKNEAEDLTQDIICALLGSVQRLKNDEAFFGFMWRTAENTLRARLRRRQRSVTLDEGLHGAYWAVPEEELINSEELRLLRRELSLLSRQYREVTVGYYIHGKSCSQLSAELGVSPEMVKYYLFKTRKILKEGIDMTREYGEKSYAPGVFRPDYWTNGSNIEYRELFRRRLPGNILLAAYDKPMTLAELSLELGVAAAYLEDELGILIEHEIIKESAGKYQTNIIIFTDEYEKRVLEKFKPVYEPAAARFAARLNGLMPELKKLEFHGSGYDENRLRWTFTNIALYLALRKADSASAEKYGGYPLLSNGSRGFIFGYDNDYVNHRFNGIYGCCMTGSVPAWFSAINYRLIEGCQKWQSGPDWDKSIGALCDAILFADANADNDEITRYISEDYIASDGGKLSPNFPVFTQKCFEELEALLAPLIDEACGCMAEICQIAAGTLKDYVPKVLKNKCGQLVHIRHQMDGMAFIAETMASDGQLMIPEGPANLCMFGVDMR